MNDVNAWAMVEALAKKIETSAALATPQELAWLGTAAERIAGQASMLEIAKYIQASKVMLDEIVNDTKDQIAATVNAGVTNSFDVIAQKKLTALQELTDALDIAMANFTSLKQTYLTDMQDQADTLISSSVASLQDLQLELDRITNTYNAMKESMTPSAAELYFMSAN